MTAKPSRNKRRVRHLASPIAILDTTTARLPPKTADPFYLSKPWRDLVGSILAERGRRCEECGRTDGRIYGDHIVELRDGGEPLDRRNILMRCHACHERKGAAERARRAAAR